MIMIFIATIAIMGMKYSKLAVNHYEDTYVKEQAQLFLQNAKEWALYEISGHQRTSNCWAGGTLKKNDLITSAKKPAIDFIATVTAERYFLLNPSTDYTTCAALREAIQTPESHGMVQLFITIKSDGAKNEIVLKDRSIQRP